MRAVTTETTVITAVPTAPTTPIADATLIDHINVAHEIDVIDLIHRYDEARIHKDNAEAIMKDLKEQLTLGLGAIADIVSLDPEAYRVEIQYPDASGNIERWQLGLQVNRYDRLSVPKLLALGVSPDTITLATDHPVTSFTTVKRLKS
jgi:hypothetical protein